MTDKTKPVLVVRDPEGDRNEVLLSPGEEFRIGRTSANEVVLPRGEVSRVHARVFFREGDYWVEDAGSTNGTLCNGEQLAAPRVLAPGDFIEIGPFRLEFSPVDTVSGARVSDEGPSATLGSLSMADFVAIPADEAVTTGRGGAEERADRLLRNIDRIGNSLLAIRPMDELLDEVVGLAADILKPERVALLLEEGDDLAARAVWQSGKGGSDDIVVSRSIAREAMEKKCSLLVGDASSDDRFRMQESIVNLKIHSAMVAPLWSGEEVIGIIYVDNRTGVVPFTEEDLRLVTLLAHLSAVKIRETRAFEELQEKQRMEQEMSYAADIQRGLLPSGKMCASGYCIAGLNESSLEVGGDYFDYFEDNGRIWVALGDVSGKGMSAALLMSAVHASVRALVDAGLSLEDVIDRLNRGVYRDSGPAQFITLFVMVIDPEKDEIQIANAGHNPGYLARASGEVEQLDAGGLMVGAFPDLTCETAKVSLGPGESILLYSDGITEAENEKEEEYGEERTIEFLKQNSGPDTEAFVDALLESAKEFTAGVRLGDDLTAVIVRKE